MEDLIKALQIFLNYKNEKLPTQCNHHILLISGITENEISKEDKKILSKLSFFWNEEYECWASYRFGSY